MRDARDAWTGMAVEAIPSKSETPHLDAFLVRARREMTDAHPDLLDLGCGDGRLSAEAAKRGFRVLGVDINPGAIQAAQARLADVTESLGDEKGLSFNCCDIASREGLGVASPAFDVVVCQLVISIVGDLASRRQLLKNAYDSLRLNGLFHLSASAVSDSINPDYAHLYAEDAPLIGEEHSYYSRDSEGEILYTTHHFTTEELSGLLDDTGFQNVTIAREEETSSRRANEAAYFLYASAKKR